MLKRIAVAAIAMSIATGAAAVGESNKTVDRFGLQRSGSLAFFSTLEASGVTNCQWGLVYMDVSTDFGKTAVAHLMAARAAGKKLKWFEFSVATNGLCYLDSIEAER